MGAYGKIAGACTTSGMAYKVHGRVGDSPIIGSGLFIDGDVGGATATGVGEAVIRVSGASAVVEAMRRGATPEEACYEVTHRILKKHPEVNGLQVGFLALNNKGEYGGYSVYNGFNFAVRHEGQDVGRAFDVAESLMRLAHLQITHDPHCASNNSTIDLGFNQ